MGRALIDFSITINIGRCLRPGLYATSPHSLIEAHSGLSAAIPNANTGSTNVLRFPLGG